jgi:hypothetical protein
MDGTEKCKLITVHAPCTGLRRIKHLNTKIVKVLKLAMTTSAISFTYSGIINAKPACVYRPMIFFHSYGPLKILFIEFLCPDYSSTCSV